MKILISTTEGGKNDSVCPIFGRCPTFTIVAVEGDTIGDYDVITNPGGQAGGGAGIAAAQAVIDAGANVVITGNCGPNALSVLLQASIKVYSSNSLVEDAVKDLLAGKLVEMKTPSVSPQSGMGPGRGRGLGRGRGFGGGR